MRTAIGYTRVSTEGQAFEGVSLEAQRERISLWAKANDYNLIKIHVDAGISGGKTENRPALKMALKQVISGPHALVVYSLSRLARSTRDTLAISDQLDKAGADLVSLSEKIDTTSASGKMIFRLLAVLAEFERDLIGERTKSAMNHLRKNRRLIGAIPYGYDLASDGETLLDNKQEQKNFTLIMSFHAKGYSFRQIKTELEKLGIKAKRGGNCWHPSGLRYMIKNAKKWNPTQSENPDHQIDQARGHGIKERSFNDIPAKSKRKSKHGKNGSKARLQRGRISPPNSSIGRRKIRRIKTKAIKDSPGSIPGP